MHSAPILISHVSTGRSKHRCTFVVTNPRVVIGRTKMANNPKRLAPNMSVNNWSPIIATSCGRIACSRSTRLNAHRLGFHAGAMYCTPSSRAMCATRLGRASFEMIYIINPAPLSRSSQSFTARFTFSDPVGVKVLSRSSRTMRIPMERNNLGSIAVTEGAYIFGHKYRIIKRCMRLRNPLYEVSIARGAYNIFLFL